MRPLRLALGIVIGLVGPANSDNGPKSVFDQNHAFLADKQEQQSEFNSKHPECRDSNSRFAHQIEFKSRNQHFASLNPEHNKLRLFGARNSNSTKANSAEHGQINLQNHGLGLRLGSN